MIILAIVCLENFKRTSFFHVNACKAMPCFVRAATVLLCYIKHKCRCLKVMLPLDINDETPCPKAIKIFMLNLAEHEMFPVQKY